MIDASLLLQRRHGHLLHVLTDGVAIALQNKRRRATISACGGYAANAATRNNKHIIEPAQDSNAHHQS
jgi:hypothetical protein